MAILEAVDRVFFQRKEPKKRLIWVYGEKNSGKSTFVDCLGEIFSTQEFNFKSNYCPMDEAGSYATKKPWAVQIYTSHEFDVKESF